MMSQFMAEAGFQVECAVDGLSGVALAQSQKFDVILLDVGLPQLDGFSVLHRIRRTLDTPIIMLTSRITLPDRLIGLNNGADDYLAKPFDPDELVARIRAIIRRYNPRDPAAAVRDFGSIRINETERTVLVDGKQIELTAIEYEVLLMLCHSAGRVVTRDALTQAAQDRQPSFFDRSLDVHVSRIRNKLGKAGRSIRTIRGEGYALTGPEGKNDAVP